MTLMILQKAILLVKENNMSKKGQIIWLASYPKSGNTWLRILLSNYLNTENDLPVDINQINASIISSSRTVFDDQLPFLSSDLNYEEIDNLRPLAYQAISDESESYQYIKTHDAFTINKNDEAIFPISASKALIYIVRNPLDVAISFAHHSHISIDKSIQHLNKDDHALSCKKNRLNSQLRQKLLSWSMHYESWKQFEGPSLLIKYEDLIKDTEANFRKIILFLYKDVNEQKLKQAVEYSSFDYLKKQETKQSFKEKPLKAESFFRKGVSGGWKEDLTEAQIQSIKENHQEVMKELGYLNN